MKVPAVTDYCCGPWPTPQAPEPQGCCRSHSASSWLPSAPPMESRTGRSHGPASNLSVHADVAQLAEAQALGACQCGFESRRRHELHSVESGALELLSNPRRRTARHLQRHTRHHDGPAQRSGAAAGRPPTNSDLPIRRMGQRSRHLRRGRWRGAPTHAGHRRLQRLVLAPSVPRHPSQGFTDAHTTHGRGFSTSWLTDEWMPAFVRLDHALTGDGLVSTGVEDFTVPGSDHRVFVVSVAPAQ
jgi:hypothetical protein